MKTANIYRGEDNESYLIVNASNPCNGVYWQPFEKQFVEINPLSVANHANMPFERLSALHDCPKHITSYLDDHGIAFASEPKSTLPPSGYSHPIP